MSGELGSGDGESQNDAIGFSWGWKTEPSKGKMSVDIESPTYNMNHRNRGVCWIFNNMDFEPFTHLNARRGTNVDAKSLHDTFQSLDFSVRVCQDYGVREIEKTLEMAAKENYSDVDCFACCILTHGDDGWLFGKDGRFATKKVFEPFRGSSCPTLAGKPKIFLIQACQGDKLDAGVKMKAGSDFDSPSICTIPNHADFLIVYSTVPGHYSWRNTSKGSWFMQAVSEVLSQHGRDMDLLEMTTIISRKVAYEYRSCTPDDPTMDNMKQVPYVTSTLTRKIFFPPKK